MSIHIAQYQDGNQFVMACDFCARPEGKGVLIASPSAKHICDECVDLCAKIVAERRQKLSESRP